MELVKINHEEEAPVTSEGACTDPDGVDKTAGIVHHEDINDQSL